MVPGMQYVKMLMVRRYAGAPSVKQHRTDHFDSYTWKRLTTFTEVVDFALAHQRDAPCIAPRRSLVSKVTHGGDQRDAPCTPKRRSVVGKKTIFLSFIIICCFLMCR